MDLLVLSSNFGYGNSERRELVSGCTYVQSDMGRPLQISKEILGRYTTGLGTEPLIQLTWIFEEYVSNRKCLVWHDTCETCDIETIISVD